MIVSTGNVISILVIAVNLESVTVNFAVPVLEDDFISQSCRVEVPDTEKFVLASNT
ncbi:hypothetical protein D3C85_1702450 [compost metagenome]